MRVQELVGVAKDLQVDPPKGGVRLSACCLDGFSERVHVLEKSRSVSPGQICEPIDSMTVDEGDRVAG